MFWRNLNLTKIWLEDVVTLANIMMSKRCMYSFTISSIVDVGCKTSDMLQSESEDEKEIMTEDVCIVRFEINSAREFESILLKIHILSIMIEFILRKKNVYRY